MLTGMLPTPSQKNREGGPFFENLKKIDFLKKKPILKKNHYRNHFFLRQIFDFDQKRVFCKKMDQILSRYEQKMAKNC